MVIQMHKYCITPCWNAVILLAAAAAAANNCQYLRNDVSNIANKILPVHNCAVDLAQYNRSSL